MAEIRDAAIQNTIVNPRGANICPDMPFKSASGINTTQVVTVPPKIDWMTLPVPSSAASIYSRKPCPLWERKQLSRTTMELSTIIPTPRTRLPMVTTFNENPMTDIRISAARMDTGIELPTIRDALISPKNRKMMIMEIITAMTMVVVTDFNADVIWSLVSFTTMTSSCGCSAFSVSIVRFTDFDTSTALLFCCLLMDKDMVSSPL